MRSPRPATPERAAIARGRAWTSSSVAVSGLVDLALTPDGQQLIAISRDKLHRVSLARFAGVGTATAAEMGVSLRTLERKGADLSVRAPNRRAGIAVAKPAHLNLYS
jgi:hypothetical protein